MLFGQIGCFKQTNNPFTCLFEMVVVVLDFYSPFYVFQRKNQSRNLGFWSRKPTSKFYNCPTRVLPPIHDTGFIPPSWYCTQIGGTVTQSRCRTFNLGTVPPIWVLYPNPWSIPLIGGPYPHSQYCTFNPGAIPPFGIPYSQPR